jgi:hypothetical protein
MVYRWLGTSTQLAVSRLIPTRFAQLFSGAQMYHIGSHFYNEFITQPSLKQQDSVVDQPWNSSLITNVHPCRLSPD